jgi:mono/diheme cytochrome c family protein
MTHKLSLGIMAVLCFAGLAWAQNPPVQSPHGYNITEQDRDQKNPNPFTQESIDHGKKLFLSQCSMCHGDDGTGNGEVAQELKANPPDLTKAETVANRTDGELFAILSQGSALMPGQGKRMRDEHKWDLVNYLRFLGGKSPSAKQP